MSIWYGTEWITQSSKEFYCFKTKYVFFIWGNVIILSNHCKSISAEKFFSWTIHMIFFTITFEFISSFFPMDCNPVMKVICSFKNPFKGTVIINKTPSSKRIRIECKMMLQKWNCDISSLFTLRKPTLVIMRSLNKWVNCIKWIASIWINTACSNFENIVPNVIFWTWRKQMGEKTIELISFICINLDSHQRQWIVMFKKISWRNLFR